jgi:hypothetical protein
VVFWAVALIPAVAGLAAADEFLGPDHGSPESVPVPTVTVDPDYDPDDPRYVPLHPDESHAVLGPLITPSRSGDVGHRRWRSPTQLAGRWPFAPAGTRSGHKRLRTGEYQWKPVRGP